jgi:hypothetical protein
MNHRRKDSNRAISYRLILLGLAALLFIGISTPDEIRLDPLVGLVRDQTGAGIAGVEVVSMAPVYSDLSPADSIYDSATTSDNGEYYMDSGFPNHYLLPFTCYCPSDWAYDRMWPFVLRFVDEQQIHVAGKE